MIEERKEEKDNEFKNGREGYETTLRTLETELTDGNQQIQSLKEEKVNVYLCITLPGVYNSSFLYNNIIFRIQV